MIFDVVLEYLILLVVVGELSVAFDGCVYEINQIEAQDWACDDYGVEKTNEVAEGTWKT